MPGGRKPRSDKVCQGAILYLPFRDRVDSLRDGFGLRACDIVKMSTSNKFLRNRGPEDEFLAIQFSWFPGQQTHLH
jgi:hypothetical protein